MGQIKQKLRYYNVGSHYSNITMLLPLVLLMLYCLVTNVVAECPPGNDFYHVLIYIYIYIHTIVIGIYLMHNKVCYTNVSYFLHEYLRNKDIICGHSDAGGGQWLYPNGTTCTNTSSPIQCTHDTDGNTIVLRRVANTFRMSDELGYTCYLPHSCNNASTDMITANIYCKSFKIIEVLYFIAS